VTRNRDILSDVKRLPNALVIDDDTQVLAFVANVLRSDGWRVSEAGTAEEAFGIVHEQPWTLVFCDVVLGGLDGYEVLRRFSDEQKDARFVLMTGHGSAAGALDATAIGAHDYLIKPFSVDDILRIARDIRSQEKLTSSISEKHRHQRGGKMIRREFTGAARSAFLPRLRRMRAGRRVPGAPHIRVLCV